MRKYLKAAFLYRWNMLLFFGATAFAAISPWPDAVLPIVGALEIAYLAGLTAMPRFRTAIDAQAASEERDYVYKRTAKGPAQDSLQRMLDTLPAS